MKELFRRRVPQLLGAYLLAGWGMVQFVQFLESRYQLTRNLVELCGLLWLLLLPSVVVLAYYHGAPGADRWRRREKIGVPLNVGIAAVVLVLAFGGRSFGTVVRAVQVVDEEGVARERLIPKGDYLRRVMIFPFQSDAEAWLGDATAQALYHDLLQEPALVVYEYFAQAARLERLGSKDGRQLSDASKRRIAEEMDVDWWVDGAVQGSTEAAQLQLHLFHVDEHDRVGEHAYTGEFFDGIDELSVQLKELLGLPRSYLQQSEDRPVGEIFCSDGEALRAFVEGQYALSIDNDYAAALAALERAIGHDPSFCTAIFTAFAAQSYANDVGAANTYLQQAMQHIYRVPERFGYQIKMSYFMNVRSDGERAMKVGAMWSELYPQDIAAHLTLATLHVFRQEKEQAIARFRRVLELDPRQRDALHTISELLVSQGEYDQATEVLSSYAQNYPDDARAHRALGSLQLTLGDLAAARESFERALLADPTSVSTQLQLVQLDIREGQFARAESALGDLLATTTNGRDRLAIWSETERYRRGRGRLRDALAARDRYFEEAPAVLSPVECHMQQIFSLETLREAGELDRYEREIETLSAGLTGVMQSFAHCARAMLSACRGQEDATLRDLRSLRDFIEQSGLDILEDLALGAELILYEEGDRHAEALAVVDRRIASNGLSLSSVTQRGRHLSRLARHDEARAELERALRMAPADGQANYEMAVLLEALGAREPALEHVERALRCWEGADAGYPRRVRAEALRAQLLTAG